MRHFKAFPEIEIPTWAESLPWSDDSWHNDACAKMARVIYDRVTLYLWVAEAEAEAREMPLMSRYAMSMEIDNGEVDPIVLWEAEAEAEARANCEAVVKAFSLRN